MKYRLFIDESGDTSLSSINADFPVFALVGCVFEETEYQEVCTRLSALKVKFFGSDSVILHSRDIRKCEGVFVKLFDLQVKKDFYQELNDILKVAKFTVVSVVIEKERFIEKYGKIADDPYELSLSFLLERVIMETDNRTRIIEGRVIRTEVEITIESRGAREDGILQRRYNELIDRGTSQITPERFKHRFVRMSFRKKRENDCGLQIADLCAYPIARHIINPNEPYPAFDIVEKKLRKGSNGKVLGYGLKIFP